jgi:hypothetical protein
MLSPWKWLFFSLLGVVVAASLVAAALKLANVIPKSATRTTLRLVEIATRGQDDARQARGHFVHSLKRPPDEISGSKEIIGHCAGTQTTSEIGIGKWEDHWLGVGTAARLKRKTEVLVAGK